MKTPSFVKVNEKEKFEIQLSGKGLTNESLRTSIEELEQFLRAEGTEKRTLDLDLTHNPDVTDDSDDSDPGEAGFTSGFNFSAKAAISKGHFASFATRPVAVEVKTSEQGTGGTGLRGVLEKQVKEHGQSRQSLWKGAQSATDEILSAPAFSAKQTSEVRKSAITPAGTSSSISLGAGWGRGRWEGHLELVGIGIRRRRDTLKLSRKRHGRLWHGVRLGFGQGGRPDRPMGPICFGSGRMRRRRNWRSWHHLKHLAAKSTMKTMDRCERQQGHPFPDRRPMTWNQSWKRRKMSTKSWSLGSEGELVCALFAVDCFWDYRWKDQWADPATWHVVFEAMRTLVKEDNKSFSKMWLTDDSDSLPRNLFRIHVKRVFGVEH